MIDMQQLQAIANKWNTKQNMTMHFPRQHCIKQNILFLTDVTVNNCAWNYIISLNEKNIYIGRKTMQTTRAYFV